MAGIVKLGLTSINAFARRLKPLPTAVNNVFLIGKRARRKPCGIQFANRSYSCSAPVLGFEEFFDVRKPNEVVSAGRSWTCSDLRRKSFEDLHRLWFILYKERNLLLTDREKSRRNGRPIASADEGRYIKTKRSMAAIKHVLHERRRIRDLIDGDQDDFTEGTATDDACSSAEQKLRGELKPGFRHVKTSPFAHPPNYGKGASRKRRERRM